ncbi:MAG TPA: hypothetical protein VFM42_00425 [Sphingomicrobium sp.]|jgi:hypothetical protein|nr:hypothetical protein [Sphingomicrobium sp.]
MAKLLLIVVVALAGIFADGFTSTSSQPPLLIDSNPPPTPVATLDEAD